MSVADRVRNIEAKTTTGDRESIKPVFPLHLTRFQRRGADGSICRQPKPQHVDAATRGQQIIVARDLPDYIQAIIFEHSGTIDHVVLNSRDGVTIGDLLKLIDRVAEELRLDVEGVMR